MEPAPSPSTSTSTPEPEPQPETTAPTTTAPEALGSIPSFLSVEVPNGPQAVAGVYRLVPETMPNGKPLWKHTELDRWIYHMNNGKWGIGGASQHADDFDSSLAYTFCPEPTTARSRSPAERDCVWRRWKEGAWGADLDICVMALSSYPSTSTSPAEVGSGNDEKAVVITLIKCVEAGDIFLFVASEEGFQVGRVIVLDEATKKEELAKISAFGSIIVDKPLKFDHEKGTTIKMLSKAAGISTNTTEPHDANDPGTESEVGLVTDGASSIRPFYAALAFLSYSTIRWLA